VSRRAWLLVSGLAVALVVLVVLVVLATSASDTPTVTVPTVPLQGPPVPSSTTTPALATSVLAMGQLSDPANTFYELLDRPSGASGWALATPPGIADNGGLVVGPSSTGAVTAGFLPAADLTFSVLAARAAGSTQWTPGDVPGTLAAEPDAVATGPAGQRAAVLSGAGTPVEAQGPGGTSWHRLVAATDLTGAHGGCRVTRVTSVAVVASGVPYVGTRCTGAQVGIFLPSEASVAAGPDLDAPAGGWSRVGPTLGASGVSATTVLRLQAQGTGIAGLAEGSGSGRSSIVGVWGASGTGITASSPLTVPSGWAVRSTATGGAGGQGLAVLLGATGTGSLRLMGVAGPGRPWVPYATPPAGTTSVALVGDEVDAFVPAGSTLHVWAATGAGTWHQVARLTVPIQYGSSS
jgi:hypothetical protein